MIQTIHTERLTLCPFTESDAEFIILLLNSESWLKYIGDRKVHSPEDAINYLQKGPMTVYREKGYGMYKVLDKYTNNPIGMCGLIKRDEFEFPDIGFAFLPEYEGKCYAYEAAGATLAFAKSELEIKTVLAITVDHNTRSRNLLERLGLMFQKTFRKEGDEEELMLYCNSTIQVTT